VIGQGTALDRRVSSALPAAVDAERSVCGAVLLHPRVLPLVSDLPASDFMDPKIEAIWITILELDAAGEAVDVLTVGDRMRAEGRLEKLRAVNGEAFFAELTSSVMTIENIEYHVDLVRARARRRRLAIACGAAQAGLINGAGSDLEILDSAERTLTGALDVTAPASAVSAASLMPAAFRALERRAKERGLLGVPSGLEALDQLTGGFRDSNFIVIGGRPSMGKTALALGAALCAARAGIPVLFFSLEQSKEELMDRALAWFSLLDVQDLSRGRIRDQHWLPLTKAATTIGGLPLEIDDRGGLSLSQVRGASRRWRAARPGQRGIVFLDYLQLVSSDHKIESREREISAISSGFKALAKDLRVPLVALSQLNRGCEARTDKRPMCSDLRDSGSLEQDADLILFPFRPFVYDSSAPEAGAEIIIGKQRNGPTGIAQVAYSAPSTRFADTEAP
jgi:replicative DNA helicase